MQSLNLNVTIATFEAALVGLRQLANSEYNEAQYQQWFEQHPIIFQSYGYRNVIPHPELKFGDFNLIPDFMVQRLDGLWEIFEIKRPDTSILTQATTRQKFYASLESYYSQCREYSSFFDDAAHRNFVREKYGIHVQQNPHTVLVAGRTEGLDRDKVHQLLFDRGSKVALQTYDDVAERLEFYRLNHFGRFEDLPGLSVHMQVVLFETPGRDNYVFDVGTTLDRDRVSIFVDKANRLCFRVLDSTGETRQIQVPFGTGDLQFNSRIKLVLEIGTGDRRAVLRMDVNDVNVSSMMLDQHEFNVDLTMLYVIGSDVLGRAETNMWLIDLCIYGRTLQFWEKLDLSDYFKEKYKDGFSSYGEFRGKQSLHSAGHPNFVEPPHS